MRILIVEDEQPIIDSILKLLSFDADEHEVVTAKSIQEAKKKLQEFSPELALLDVNLQDGNSFTLLEELQDFSFKVIFISSHIEYGVKALKKKAVDYIVKPISPLEFREAIQKAKTEVNSVSAKPAKNKIILNASDKIYVLSTDIIVHCHADGNYTHIYMSDKRHIVVTKKIGELEEMLDKTMFIRCHLSHIININHIIEIDKKNGDEIVLTNDDRAILSKSKKQELLNLLSR